MIVGADILVMAVLHTESAGDNAELDKSKALIQVPRVRVGRDDGVELLFPFQFWRKICSPVTSGQLLRASPSSSARCRSTAVIWWLS